jgi:hypothetical protein
MQTTIDSPSCPVAVLDQVLRALPEAANLAQIIGLRNQAEAVRQYARKAALRLEMQNRAVEVKLAAERRAGEVLRAMRLRGGDRRSGGRDDTRLEDLPGTVWQQGKEGMDGADAVKLRGPVWPSAFAETAQPELTPQKKICSRVTGQSLPHSPWRGYNRGFP